MATPQQGILGHIPGSIYAVASYYSDNDSTQHAVAATTDGVLYEIHWNQHTAPTPPQRLAQFNGIICITGFYTLDDGFQHIIVATNDGNLHEVYFDDAQHSQVRSPLIHLKSIIGPHVGMAGFFSPDDNLRHAAVVDKDGELHETTYNAEKAPAADDFATQFDLADIAGISGFFTLDDYTRHIIVAIKDGRVYDINYTTDQNAASTTFLTQFNDHLVNVASFFTPDNNYRHVIGLTDKGTLYDYSRTYQTEFGQSELATISAIVDIAAHYSAYDNNRHVIAGTTDGALHEIYYPPLGA